MPGPPRKRDAERRRKNDYGTITVDLAEVAGTIVEVPAPNDDWHPVAFNWYMSLTESLVCKFYEPSDWAFAAFLADQLDLELKPRPVQTGTDAEGNPVFEIRRVPIIGAKMNAILKGMTQLLVTEYDRRKLALETERPDSDEDSSSEGDATVTSIREGLIS